MAEYIDRGKIFPNGVFYVNKNQPEKSLDELINRICKAPAADVVEVVHGEWIITEEILETIKECSCCHCKTYYPKPLSFNVRKSPFCEDCGAKMDGKGG